MLPIAPELSADPGLCRLTTEIWGRPCTNIIQIHLSLVCRRPLLGAYVAGGRVSLSAPPPPPCILTLSPGFPASFLPWTLTLTTPLVSIPFGKLWSFPWLRWRCFCLCWVILLTPKPPFPYIPTPPSHNRFLYRHIISLPRLSLYGTTSSQPHNSICQACKYPYLPLVGEHFKWVLI